MDISVIIPYYNSSEIIERTLESIKDQTYLPKEVIIVDDCSINSYDLGFIEKNKAYYPFELEIIRHKHNKGAPAARNTGIKASKFEFVAFLDADDCWVEDKLERQIKAIGDFDLLYSNYSETKDVLDFKKNESAILKKVGYTHVLRKNLSPVTLLVKKSSIIFFDERFRRCDDFKMSIEALASGHKIGFLDIDVAYGFKRSIGEGGLTGSLTKMSLSFIKACLVLIYERPKNFFRILPFIIFELLKFPIRCLKVYSTR